MQGPRVWYSRRELHDRIEIDIRPHLENNTFISK